MNADHATSKSYKKKILESAQPVRVDVAEYFLLYLQSLVKLLSIYPFLYQLSDGRMRAQ